MICGRRWRKSDSTTQRRWSCEMKGNDLLMQGTPVRSPPKGQWYPIYILLSFGKCQQKSDDFLVFYPLLTNFLDFCITFLKNCRFSTRNISGQRANPYKPPTHTKVNFLNPRFPQITSAVTWIGAGIGGNETFGWNERKRNGERTWRP